ncbi:TraB/GumN family protein [Veronia nyctiphanis]|uniref:TraB/GumN family protein n=1 Tax=Veronia nyctiphanis TaxID=1278244 RepID=A0A4Q0YRX6_9GAMM|nr:TraB/GumN family protein [Veronia nyctiphanis]RXJ73876.1 TraB/GumN family protein [Veronia nyctiphanis]
MTEHDERTNDVSKQLKLRVITFFLLTLSSFSQAAPAVWQAEKDGTIITLFGSIHMGIPSFYPLPDIVETAFIEADALVVEVDLNTITRPQVPDRRNSYQALNISEKRQLETVAPKAGVDLSLLYAMQPWQAAMALQLAQAKSLGLRPDFGIDVHFIQKSNTYNKPVIALESMEEQFSVLTSMEDGGKNLLLETMDDWEQKQADLKCLLSAWQQGDDTTLTNMSTYFENTTQFAESMLFERNRDWVEQLSDPKKFKKGKYLLVAGDLHFRGKQGVLSLLQKEGFSVRRLNKGGKVSCFPKERLASTNT